MALQETIALESLANANAFTKHSSEAKFNRIRNDDEDVEKYRSSGESTGVVNGPIIETWKSPSINKFRVGATYFAFITLGMNDATPGALLPYLEEYYHKSYTLISLVFLAPFVGYTIAAVLNQTVHSKFGRFGVAVIGPGLQFIAYSLVCWGPPYPVLIIAFAISGLGIGCQDSGWCTFIGQLAESNKLQGFLHGFYGVGATISPSVATVFVTKGHYSWHYYYFIMMGLVAVSFVVQVLAFRGENGAKYLASSMAEAPTSGPQRSQTRRALSNKTVWFLCLFLAIYVGAEVTVGGWLLTFMINIRNGERTNMGYVVSGFWIGLTIGRVTLGFVSEKYGEKKMLTIYLLFSIAMEFLFWLIPNLVVSAVAIALLGFFIGPAFPTAMVVATKVLPRSIQVAGIGFAAALGGCGAAFFPWMTGAIASSKGVSVLQPIVLALLIVLIMAWVLIIDGMGTIWKAEKTITHSILQAFHKSGWN